MLVSNVNLVGLEEGYIYKFEVRRIHAGYHKVGNDQGFQEPRELP